MRSLILLAASIPLGLAGCGEPVRDDHYANSAEAQAPAAPPRQPVQQQAAVRVGELGPSFDACAAAGTTRHVEPGEALPVRAAPFDDAGETGGIPSGQRFFVCTRSHNQKWLGVVYDESGTLASRCGVSTPVTSRRDYPGPCRSGWVASAFVRLVAGDAPTQPAAESQTGG